MSAPPEVHPSAAVAAGARLGPGCRVGPFCAIGPDAVLEEGVELVSHVVVE
ncbi:MAG: acyl-[acyl-carrier-protein]--UDP-N-acetylglucosamine O-acyltransferase, partial [Acetobacteraceae bacterium]|nr:acyl-[acyl-carrier-protein]--UDP-N-acetylglucosamine O-acyltransferase [Acetobacteraceae bacterium]